MVFKIAEVSYGDLCRKSKHLRVGISDIESGSCQHLAILASGQEPALEALAMFYGVKCLEPKDVNFGPKEKTTSFEIELPPGSGLKERHQYGKFVHNQIVALDLGLPL